MDKELIYILGWYGFFNIWMCYATYFISKVSKGLGIFLLYDLVYRDPIDDESLHYTFYHLFWCRVAIFMAWFASVALGGLLYGTIRSVI